MKKNITYFLLIVLIQISPRICAQFEVLRNEDVFFNQKMFNPTNLTDSGSYIVDMCFHDQWLSLDDDFINEFNVSAEVGYPSINSSIGINADFMRFGLLKEMSFLGSYKYRFHLGDFSIIESGIDFGLGRTKLDKGLLDLGDDFNDEFNPNNDFVRYYPIMDIGIAYKYHNQKLSISCNNMIESYFDSTHDDYEFEVDTWIVGYQGAFKISPRVSLIPEVYAHFSPDDMYSIFVARVDYANSINGGFLYNTEGTLGITFSGVIKNIVKLGAYCYLEVFEDDGQLIQDDDYKEGFMGFEAGVIINHKRK